jgi:hypothetical protein
VLWTPAFNRPAGANTPGKVSSHGTTMRALNRYPLDSARSARERRIENCANSRIAVIASIRNVAVA